MRPPSLRRVLRYLLRKVGLELIPFQTWMDFNGLLKLYDIKTVIDVGANTGQTVLEVMNYSQQINVHSFEPIQSVFNELVKNTKKYSNVVCYQHGLGERVESVVINVNEASQSSSILELAETHKRNFDFAVKTHQETIKITTLDAFFEKKRFDKSVLLKIDVQGFEKSVLLGAKEALKQVDVIFIESTFQELYKDQVLFGDLFNLLNQFGFNFVGFVEAWYDAKTKDTLYGNAIFRKR
jgi:FkbM family methyltransferase